MGEIQERRKWNGGEEKERWQRRREEIRKVAREKEKRRGGEERGRRKGGKVLFFIQIFKYLDWSFVFLLNILNFACSQMHLDFSLRFIPLLLVEKICLCLDQLKIHLDFLLAPIA